MITEIIVPRINANDDTIEVVHWHVEDGGWVAKGGELVDIGTSKMTVTLDAEMDGFVRHLFRQGDIVPVLGVLGSLSRTMGQLPPPVPKTPLADSAMPETGTARTDTRRLSRQARDLEQTYSGTIPEGLVTAKSLRMASDAGGPPRSIRVSRAKQAEIRSLSIGQQGNINTSLAIQFPSENLRKSLAGETERNSILPWILHRFAQTVSRHPLATAFYSADAIHFYDRVDVGVALDIGKGLKVVTIKAADKLNPGEMRTRLLDIQMRYLGNRLALEELSDSTVTVTDLSEQNILYSQPLINHRQSLILGVGGDQTLPGSPISLTATFDHRVLSGMEVAVLLNEMRAGLSAAD